jgi:hypothetical protein
MSDNLTPVTVRLELIGSYPGVLDESPQGKVKTYPYLPRINDFIFYGNAWYQVFGVYMYPYEDEASLAQFGITLKVKYVEGDRIQTLPPNEEGKQRLQIADD